MIGNLVTSLFLHERIESTHARAKVVRSFAEKLITRAKKNLQPDITPEKKLHNLREVMRTIHNKMVVDKLFNDIAHRFKDRNGGYTRIYKLVNRLSDNTERSLIELVERKDVETLKEEARAKRKPKKAPAKSQEKSSSKDSGKEKSKDKSKKKKD